MSATKRLCVAVWGLLALVLPGAVLAGTPLRDPTGGRTADHRGDNQQKNVRYCIVATKDTSGDVSFEVKPLNKELDKGIEESQESLMKTYKEEYQNWLKDKKNTKKPVRPVVARYSSEKVKATYRTEDEAKEVKKGLDKMLEEESTRRKSAEAAAELKAASAKGGGDKPPAKKDGDEK